jgi:hypothetical protein
MTLDDLQRISSFRPNKLPFVANGKSTLTKAFTGLVYRSIGSIRAGWFLNLWWRWWRVVFLLSCQFGDWGFDFLLRLLFDSDMSIGISG